MESRLLMARVPKGATIIDNTTGGPQGFQMGNVFVMAGVPMVMQSMVGALTKERLGGTDEAELHVLKEELRALIIDMGAEAHDDGI